jgi:putative oxidoreductase
MGIIRSLNKWANANSSHSITGVRALLGVFLFFKGVYFQTTLDQFMALLGADQWFTSLLLAQYIIAIHLVGGICIAMGMMTRIFLFLHIPILAGAVFVTATLQLPDYELIQAILVSCLTLFFIFYGSGKKSVDYRLQLEI